MKLDISDIIVGKRVRDVRQNTVEFIAKSFASEGQLQAILVRRDTLGFHLVAGAHRLAAASLLGWKQIEAKELDLSGMSEAMARIADEIAELDENLTRCDLDQAERVYHLERRIDATERRLKQRKLEEEEIAAKEANERVRVARAAEKAAKTKEEKAKLKAAFDAAEQERKNAANRRRRASISFSVATDDSEAGRLSPETVIEISKETGLRPSLIKDARYFAKAVGMENLKAMSGTALATQAEMRALIKLKKVNPKEAERAIAALNKNKAKGRNPGTQYSPSGMLGTLSKIDKANAEHQAMQTLEGCLKLMLAAYTEAEGSIIKARQAWGKLPGEVKNGKLKVCLSHQEAHTNIRKLIQSMARPPKQKRTGTEGRYATEPAESPTKEEVRKSIKLIPSQKSA